MALFRLFYDRSVHSNAIPPVKSFTKAEAEAIAGQFAAAMKVFGPPEECVTIEVEAGNETEAAQMAKYICGAKEGEGEILIVEAANVKKKKAH